MSACDARNIALTLKNAREQVAPQPVATDTDPLESEIYKHLDSMFDRDAVDFVATALGLRRR